MNISLLHSFIADQRKAKQLVSRELGLPVDMLAMDWAHQYSSIRKQYAKMPFADLFEPHGFGLELRIGDFYIDYDYSQEGRADGFDPWRIFVHIMAGHFDNRGPDQHFRDRVFDWIDKLQQAGHLTHPDNLYYFA